MSDFPPPSPLSLLSKVSIERLKSKSVLCFVPQILWPSPLPPWSHHVVNICVEISKPFPLFSVWSHADYCRPEESQESETVSVCYFIFLYSVSIHTSLWIILWSTVALCGIVYQVKFQLLSCFILFSSSSLHFQSTNVPKCKLLRDDRQDRTGQAALGRERGERGEA